MILPKEEDGGKHEQGKGAALDPLGPQAPDPMSMIELHKGPSTLTLLPELGGAVGSWTRGDTALLHPVSDPNLIAQKLQPVAAYPLIPFSNRVAFGRFTFGGEHFQLAANFGGEPHTIHGNAWERAWTVAEQQTDRAVLALEHDGPAAQWPFHYTVTLTYTLGDSHLIVDIRFENTDHRNQPVGIGFHPFFPHTEDTELCFKAGSVWQVGNDSLPNERLPIDGKWRFDPSRAVGDAALDNCYAGRRGPAELRWPSRSYGMRILASESLGHLVVYTPPGRPYLAVEPASNMTDAVNRMQIADNGLRVLAPGESLSVQTRLERFEF